MLRERNTTLEKGNKTVAAEDKVFREGRGRAQTEKRTNFHTGFLANQEGNVILLCISPQNDNDTNHYGEEKQK